jgi:hypothetical protein
MATTPKGPYRLGDNLLMRFAGSFKLVPSSHTHSSMLNGLKRGLSLIQDSCTLRCASWAACLVSLMVSSLWFSVGMSVVQVGWWTVRVYPISRSKGDFFVVADGHEFFMYCASGNQVCQLFCFVLQ